MMRPKFLHEACSFRLPQVAIGMTVAACLIFGSAALAPPGSVTGSPESTTPIETVPALPPAKPSLRFPDRDKRSSREVKDFTPVRGLGESEDEHTTYINLLLHVRNFTADELLAGGRKDVSYADLMAEDEDHRDSYRYELIRFEGRLTRLKRIEPYPELVAQGVTEQYEAWVTTTKEAKQLCVILLEAPAGVEPNIDINPSRAVTFAGYFFKDLLFESGEKASKTDMHVKRKAPLIFAKSMTAAPLSDSDAGNIWRTSFLPAVLTTIGLLTMFVLGLTWYFRRGDRVSKRAVEAKKLNPFDGPTQIPPGEPGEFDNFSQDRP